MPSLILAPLLEAAIVAREQFQVSRSMLNQIRTATALVEGKVNFWFGFVSDLHVAMVKVFELEG